MPPRRARTIRGILGQDAYNSSDDEDWAPSPSAAQPLQHRLPHRGTRLHPPHDANDDDEEEAEEDIPLAQRRLALSARPPAAAAAAAAAGPRRWAPDLPQEVLQVVLTHACAHGAVPAAAVASCVSRSWRRAVAANPALWAAVDLSAARRPTDAAVAAHGAPRWAALRRLSLSGCTKLSDATLHAVAGACPLLQCLDLRGCSTFTPNGLSAALRIMLTRPLAPNSAPLRDIDLSLTEFKPKSSGLDSVVRALLHDQAAGPGGPCLERLILEGCPTLSHQGLRAACDAAAATASRSLGSLRELSLAGSGGLHPVFFINIERLQFASPLLQSLDLRGLCVINGWSFNAAPSALPGGAVASFAALRVLRVGDTPYAMSDSILQPKSNVTTACLARLLAGATGLEELDLSRCRVTAEGVVAALRASPALRSLTLSRAAAATDELLCSLGSVSLNQLSHLDLSWAASQISDAGVICLPPLPALVSLDLSGTGVTAAGVRAVLEAAEAEGRAAALQVSLESCRGVERGVRQAASRGMPQLRAALRGGGR